MVAMHTSTILNRFRLPGAGTDGPRRTNSTRGWRCFALTVAAVLTAAALIGPAQGAPGDLTLVYRRTVTALRTSHSDQQPSLSANGRRIAFHWLGPTSDRQNFVRDLDSGDLILASSTATGQPANYGSFDPQLSGDGMKVAPRLRAQITSIHGLRAAGNRAALPQESE